MFNTEEKGNKKLKKRWKIAIGTALVIILAVGGYVFSIYHNAKQTVNDKVYQQVESIDNEVTKKKVVEKDPLNILLLGVDERENDVGRSDALMVLTLDPKTESAQLISIPRDTRTEIAGNGSVDKINHAYAFGGPEMSIETVEEMLDIELDYYVTGNMDGLIDIVDTLGTITVKNDLDWHDEGYYKEGYHYEKGKIDLDGEKAMGFVRMRYQDPDGDFGRTERQREVIKAIIDEGASIASINKLNDMIDIVGENVVTNMDFSDMQELLMHYRDTRNNFNSYMMQGSTKIIDRISYVVVPDEEIEKVHDMITKVES